MIELRLSDGKVVGKIEDSIATIPVTSRNFLGVGHGYSVDAKVLRQIQVAGATDIVFRNNKSKKSYKISTEQFSVSAKTYNFGYGDKLVAHERLYETQ